MTDLSLKSVSNGLKRGLEVEYGHFGDHFKTLGKLNI